MFTGQKKTDYQRDYMRNYMRQKRAGLPKPEKPEKEPTAFEIHEIKCLLQSRHTRRRELQHKLHNEHSWPDAVRVLRQDKLERKEKAKSNLAKKEAIRNKWRFCDYPLEPCSCCNKIAGRLVGNRIIGICRACAEKIVRIHQHNE